MATESDDRDYAVGYGRPPVETQFKKGQSGNPRGRPPKARGQVEIATKVLNEKHRLSGQPKGSRVLFKALELVIMMLKQVAAGGRAAAATLYTQFLDRYAPSASPQDEVGYLVVPERLTEEEWEARYSPKDDPPEEAAQVE